MRQSIFALTLFLIFTLTSCFNSEKTPASSETEKQEENIPMLNYFIIGQGGGITGEYIQYRVESNGEVKQLNFDLKTYEVTKTLNKDRSSKLFSQLEKLELNAFTLDAPGNMNYYLEVPDASGSKRLLWNDESLPSENVLEYYNETWELLSLDK